MIGKITIDRFDYNTALGVGVRLPNKTRIAVGCRLPKCMWFTHNDRVDVRHVAQLKLRLYKALAKKQRKNSRASTRVRSPLTR